MCTAIKIDYDGASVMGRTMDYEVDLDYNALYLPRDYVYSRDLFARPLRSKYRTLGICFSNYDPLKDGVNEHGLIGVTNEFSGFNLYRSRPDQDKVSLASLDYMNYALMNYRSVEEVIEGLDQVQLASKDWQGEEAISPAFHYMFTDRSQRCIVVEPRKGELVYYDNTYDVMTNSPAFPSHERRLKKLFDLGDLEGFNSPKDLPGAYDPVSRFLKAFYLTRMNARSEGREDALANCYNILGAMAMPNGFVKNRKYQSTTYTRYTCAYDSGTRLLTVRSHKNPRVYHLGFEDVEDLGKRQEFFIEGIFTSDSLAGEN